jgi:two-component system LytT family response regulator
VASLNKEAIRALIAEDEGIAREHLRRLVTQEGVAVVGVCADVSTAVGIFTQQKPDVIFLDVSLQGENGFALLDRIPPDERPAVVVVTAASDHAYQAFHYEVADYLLKPFSRERMQDALRKARLWLAGRQRKDSNHPSPEPQPAAPAASGPSREFLMVKSEGRWVVLKYRDIDVALAHEHVCQVQTGKESFVIRETLSSLADRLPKERFFRINRGTIVNLERVKAIHAKSHGDGVAELKDGQSFIVSRRFRPLLNGLFQSERNS